MTALSNSPTWVLGSRSPRRLELLRWLLPGEPIRTLPPRSPEEPGFDGLTDIAAIERRLFEIVRLKSDDVVAQLRVERAAAPTTGFGTTVVISADTTIVVDDGQGTDDGERCRALGQPPEGDWKPVVRDWFQRYYLGRTHRAVTAVRAVLIDGRAVERVVTTRVSFAADAERWVDGYLDTNEPPGKAGGYAIQGAGALFVSSLDGSLTNVIGLPLKETADMLVELGVRGPAGK